MRKIILCTMSLLILSLYFTNCVTAMTLSTSYNFDMRNYFLTDTKIKLEYSTYDSKGKLMEHSIQNSVMLSKDPDVYNMNISFATGNDKNGKFIYSKNNVFTEIYMITRDQLTEGLNDGNGNRISSIMLSNMNSWSTFAPLGNVNRNITDIGKTVKTRAGTFTNCIEVTTTGGQYEYEKACYAPNIGIVTEYKKPYGQGVYVINLVTITGGTKNNKSVANKVVKPTYVALNYNKFPCAFSLRDSKGQMYDMRIYPKDAKLRIADDVGGWYEKGTKLWEGTFKVSYAKHGTKTLKTEDLKNYSGDEGFVFLPAYPDVIARSGYKGTPDFLTLPYRVSYSGYENGTYFIKNGQFIHAKYLFKDGSHSDTIGVTPEQIGDNTYTTSYIDNDEWKEIISIWKFNLATETFKEESVTKKDIKN